MKHIYKLFTVFLLFLSCNDKENPIETQESKIESYIKAKMAKNQALQLDKNGSVSYLYNPGDTARSVVAGDSVYFYYAGVLVTDTLRYFDTNIEELSNALGLSSGIKTFEPVGVIAGNSKLLKGLDIGLQMTHFGDSGEIIFNSDFGYGDKTNGIVPPYSALIFKVIITRIKKN